MAIELLELPFEMVTEIVNHVDYKGLLALREVCQLTKEIVDELCKITFIHHLYFANGRLYNTGSICLTLDGSRPPFALYSDITKEWVWTVDTKGTCKKIDVSVQKEQVSNLLEDIRSKIPQCTIDSLVFNSQDELYVSLFESFLEGLTVNKSCLDVYTEW
ncbi:hypothetical protein PENTCL1PPCAC_1306, partial [Pristionchus entomophagus]